MGLFQKIKNMFSSEEKKEENISGLLIIITLIINPIKNNITAIIMAFLNLPDCI